MAKISEIMLLQQPEQPALAIEVKTDMKGMSQAFKVGVLYEGDIRGYFSLFLE